MKRTIILTSMLIYLTSQLQASPEYQFGTYSFTDSPKNVVGVKYRGGDAASAVPLGGLGTGTVYLTSDGTFEGNALMNTYRPNGKQMPGCFFALRTDKGSTVLQAQPVKHIPGTTPVSYLGHFPMVDLDYGNPLGVNVQLRAMSPFVLGDSKISGTPGSMFKFRLTNPSDQPAKTALAFSWSMPDELPGQQASGDADGYLVWRVGRLAPGESKVIPVLYTAADSRKELEVVLKEVRGRNISPPEFPKPSVRTPVPYSTSLPTRVKNGITDFATDASGAFNHDDFGFNGCLRLGSINTLSQHTFRLYYKTDQNHSVGIAVDQPQASRLQGIEITGSTVLGSDGIARTTLQTADKAIVLQIAAQMLNGTTALRWFKLFNLSDKPVNDISLAVYANFYVSGNAYLDSGKLDVGLQALLIKASDSDKIAALAGMSNPAGGWVGNWNNTMSNLATGTVANMTGSNPPPVLECVDRPGVSLYSVGQHTPQNTGWTIGVLPQEDQTVTLNHDLSARHSNDRQVAGSGVGGQLMDDLSAAAPAEANCTAVVAEVTVPAHGFRDVEFVLSWYYPDARDSTGKLVGHQYSNWFGSSSQVANYLAKNFAKIQSRIGGWQEKIYAADQPDWLKDQLVNSLYPMVRNSAWLKDGRFSMSESFIGCPITETIVCRFYGTIPLANFFPELERNNMRQFVHYQRPDGAIPFCLGSGESWDSPIHDIQRILDSTEFALMVWRDYHYWGDKAWVSEMLPAVKRALRYAKTLDTDGDSLINDELSKQYYDAWQFYGASAYTASIQLAALRAGEELANVVGDHAFATECKEWFTRAQNRFEELLWTGDYYRLYNNPITGKKSDTCLSNQLVGQWYAYMCGLGDILPREHIDKALEHVARVNGAGTKYGLINGITPEGKPDQEGSNHSFYQTIGETYCYVSTCIRAGRKDLALPFAQRLACDLALNQRRSWNVTWNMNPETGACAWADEYYSNMCIWDLSSALAETTASTPASPAPSSDPAYPGLSRTSRYITVRDGTKLAVDILRPAQNGNPIDKPMPVIWTHARYHRSQISNGQVVTMLDWLPYLRELIKRGYVVAAVDVRGSGASYGYQKCPWPPEEAQDAYDVTEWLASQPWCNGRVGMYGGSYLGISQLFAAGTAPPHLKAIFPEVALFDTYGFFYPGGVLNSTFASNWWQWIKTLDSGGPVAHVDEDLDGRMLADAVAQHRANVDYVELFKALSFRDSRDKISDQIPFFINYSPSTVADKIQRSGVAIYHRGCWYDLFTRDTFLWYANLNNPQKMLITPGAHNGMDTSLELSEHLRWFDYWLKGINNGIMDEPPIRYYTLGAPKGKEWHDAKEWPLPGTKMTRYYLHGGHSGSIVSLNDGLLELSVPDDPAGQDAYTVDYTAGTGTSSRWYGGPEGPFDYPDLAANDKKGWTYTTSPIPGDIEVTGHPIVHLWISSTAKDGDFFAYLEAVDVKGYSHLATDGLIRASHRRMGRAPYNNLGLPYHRSFAKDSSILSGKPVELVFDLQPTSRIFHAGERIRLTITCADKDHMQSPELNPAPKVNIYRNRKMKSYVSLPVIPAGSQ